MSENRNHIKQYTAADIQRYLDGRMNATEMHAMEKAALDDPFLADAIEGFELTKKEYDNNTINSDLDQLRSQLAEKANAGKVRSIASFRWWRVAAAALVLIVFGAVAYDFWLKPVTNEQLIVVNDKKPAASEPSAAPAENAIAEQSDTINKDLTRSGEKIKDANIETEKKSDGIIDNSQKREIASAPPVTLKENNPSASASSKNADANESATVKLDKEQSKKNAVITDSVVARNQKILEYEAQRKTAVTANDDLVVVNPDKKVKDKSPGKADAGLLKGNTGSANASLNFFNGRVTDNNNLPIAGVTVQIANTRNGYTTDQYGNFRIPSPDTTVHVVITGVGFNTQSFQLQNSIAINQLQLQPASAGLSEVVITKPTNKESRRSNAKSKTIYPSVLIQDAEPANGWIEFDKYIESNKKVNPDDPNAKTGEVVISFQVNRKSELSDFKIEQRLSVAQDAEAIRLIKEGPTWRLLKGKKARIMVIIRF